MRLAFITASIVLAAGAAQAASIVGSQVSGELYFPGFPQNYFDPANERVPATYLNTAGTNVTVSASAVEFGFDDGFARITADFTGTQLTVTDLPASPGPFNSLQLIFTDSAITNLTVGPQNFPGSGLTASLDGNVATLNWSGGKITNGPSVQAVFYLNVPPSPQLKIQLTATNTVVVSWPAPATGFNLQQNTNFASTNWLAVGTTPNVVNGRNQVTVSPPVGTQFYRLKYP